MKKVYEKRFQHKGQMINYYKKMQNNKKIGFMYCGFFTDIKTYAIRYSYK